MDPTNIIKLSIANRIPVTGHYQGLLRKLCPHILGWKNGVLHVLCWQYGGKSSKGGLPQWRCLPVEEISGLKLLDEPWHTGPNYSIPLQNCVNRVIAAI